MKRVLKIIFSIIYFTFPKTDASEIKQKHKKKKQENQNNFVVELNYFNEIKIHVLTLFVVLATLFNFINLYKNVGRFNNLLSFSDATQHRFFCAVDIKYSVNLITEKISLQKNLQDQRFRCG